MGLRNQPQGGHMLIGCLEPLGEEEDGNNDEQKGKL